MHYKNSLNLDMQEPMVHPPRTIMEVFKMLPQGTLAEVIENTLYMSPTPTSQHQRLVHALLTQIDRFVSDEEIGEVFVDQLDAFLDEASMTVQSDLFLILSGNLSIADPNGHVGTVQKKDLYEKFGVREHWIAEPAKKNTLGYSVADKKFSLIGESQHELPSTLLNHSFIF
ncbi:MAG TPA: Uma2 family endonuclease [Chryseosolibacter sp.]